MQGQNTENREAVNYSGGNTGLDRTSEGHKWRDNLEIDGLLSGIVFSSLKWAVDWADPFQLWHSLILHGEAGKEFQSSRNVGQHVHLVPVISPVVHSFLKVLTLANPMDCSPTGSSAHGILQARTLESGSHSLLLKLDIILRCWKTIGWTRIPCPEKTHHLVGNVNASPFICSVWEGRKALLRIKWEEKVGDLWIQLIYWIPQVSAVCWTCT